MTDGEVAVDGAERKLRDWMFALLRFAVTHDPQDQVNALMLACELDTRDASGEVTFFQRTTSAICHATLVRDRSSERILSQFFRRIGDDRLRGAFIAIFAMKNPAKSDGKDQRPPPRASIWERR